MRSGKTIRVGDRVHLKRTSSQCKECEDCRCTLIVVSEPQGDMVACRKECSPTVDWYKISSLLVGKADSDEQ